MKKVLTLATLLILEISYAKSQTINFAGKWNYSLNNEISFDLNIQQTNNKIIGSHCSVMHSGDFIDCSVEDEPSLKGTIAPNSKTTTVTFQSFYGDGSGKATITWINRNTIVWKIIQEPSAGSGGYFIPKHATLTRQALQNKGGKTPKKPTE